MQQEIEQKIIHELGLTDASSEERERVIISLGGLVLQNVLIKVTEALPDQDMLLFETVVGSGDQEKMFAFISEKVPRIEHLIEEASKEVVEEYKKGLL